MPPERVRSFVPLEQAPLPKPLHRFGPAFPLALAEQCIAAYVPEHGVVLDPLAHPLSAADAVRRAGRHAIARAPHPLAAWASKAVEEAPPAAAVLAALEAVGESALGGSPHARAMRAIYSSRCGACRAPIVVEAFLWERDALAPTKKAFRCTVCAREGRSLLIEGVDSLDEEGSTSIEPRGLPYWQMVERFSPVERNLAETVASLFTPRNLMALMGTLRAIESSVPDERTRDVLLLALVEVLVTGSKLNAAAGHGAPLRIEKGRARRGHAAHTREINVWQEFERTVRDLVAWIGERSGPRRAREFASAEDLPGKADLVLCQAPADDLLGGWAHVASVLCLGAERAGVAEDGSRSVGKDRVLHRLRGALIDAHRRSRDDAPAVVLIERADVAAIASAALAGAGAGYRLRGVLYQRDAFGVSSRAEGAGAAAILDFDRAVPLLKDQPSAHASAIEEAMRDGVREAIVARGEPVGPEHQAAGALLMLAQRGLLAPLALARAGGLSELELFLDHFRSALGDARRSGLERVGDRSEGAASHYTVSGGVDTTPLDDRVEWGVWGLLAAVRDIEGASLLRRIYALCRDLETPDRELVERCVAAYGAQESDGRWRLRPEDALVRRQAEQASLAASLLECGHRLGFRVRVGRDLERRPLPTALADRGAILADLLDDRDRAAPLARAVRGPAEVLEQIDVIWFGRGQMVFLWQLDWTARVHRSVVQLGEAIPDDDRVFRFCAIPDERRGLVGYKMVRSEALAEAVRKRAWRFVKWSPLRRFVDDPAAALGDLEAVLGLEPAVEQAGQQMAFKW